MRVVHIPCHVAAVPQVEAPRKSFYDIFREVCERGHVARTKACIDCGLSRTAWRKWIGGGVPNGNAVAQIAQYFHVTTDYLLGLAPET